MKIAQVGASIPPTADDGFRTVEGLVSIAEFIQLKDVISEPINLEYGRDFLAERHKYDAVIVHSVFHTRPDFMRFVKSDPQFRAQQVSPLHTVEKWRKRLAATGAKVIVLFELLPMSLSGWQVSEIPGYRIHKRDGRITVYRKLSCCLQGCGAAVEEGKNFCSVACRHRYDLETWGNGPEPQVPLKEPLQACVNAVKHLKQVKMQRAAR